MTPPSAQARRERAAAEAVEWLQRLDSGGMSAGERADFVEWLRESPIHVAETLRMGQLSAELREFTAWARSTGPTDESTDKVVPLRLCRPPGPDQASVGRGWMSPARKLRMGALAACVVLALAAVAWIGRPTGVYEIRTHNGERREITLDDGSVVRLSPDTDLQVDMQATLRQLALKGGEAVFRVAKDPTRPFVVNAARARVRAIGTIFAVTRNGENVVVTVAEGQVTVAPVAVSNGQGDASVPVALRRNERVSVSPIGTVSQVRHVEASRPADWSEGQLVFENTPVGEVIAQFNRHNQLQIRVVDAKLSALAVSGIFAADDPQSFIDFLTAFAGARTLASGPALPSGANVVLVTRAAAGSPAAPGR